MKFSIVVAMNWILIWKVVFIIVIVAFTLLAVLTTVFGAQDIRNLFSDLNNASDDED